MLGIVLRLNSSVYRKGCFKGCMGFHDKPRASIFFKRALGHSNKLRSLRSSISHYDPLIEY